MSDEKKQRKIKVREMLAVLPEELKIDRKSGGGGICYSYANLILRLNCTNGNKSGSEAAKIWIEEVKKTQCINNSEIIIRADKKTLLVSIDI